METSHRPATLKSAKPIGRPYYVAAILISVGFAFLYLLRPQTNDRGIRRPQCQNNIKNLALALHNYHNSFGCFPPPYVADANGRPMHSWRVFLLPYLDQVALYEMYQFDEPWDGPNNSQLANSIVEVFNCPNEKTATRLHTNYVAVVGPGTMWPEGEFVTLDDVTDGIAQTLLVVEVENSGIHWMEPRDLHLDDMAPAINPEYGPGISSRHPGLANVAFADGRVKSLSENISPETLRALLTRNAGDTPGEY